MYKISFGKLMAVMIVIQFACLSGVPTGWTKSAPEVSKNPAPIPGKSVTTTTSSAQKVTTRPTPEFLMNTNPLSPSNTWTESNLSVSSSQSPGDSQINFIRPIESPAPLPQQMDRFTPPASIPETVPDTLISSQTVRPRISLMSGGTAAEIFINQSNANPERYQCVFDVNNTLVEGHEFNDQGILTKITYYNPDKSRDDSKTRTSLSIVDITISFQDGTRCRGQKQLDQNRKQMAIYMYRYPGSVYFSDRQFFTVAGLLTQSDHFISGGNNLARLDSVSYIDINMKIWAADFFTNGLRVQHAEYYPSGNSKKATFYVAGTNTITFINYYNDVANSKAITTDFYENGKRTKHEEYYFPSGNPKKVTFYFAGTDTITSISDYNDVANSNAIRKDYYENGKRTQHAEYYFPSGNPKEVTFYVAGTNTIIYITYFNNVKDSPIANTDFYTNGQLSSKVDYTYANGIKTATTWNPGKTMIIQIVTSNASGQILTGDLYENGIITQRQVFRTAPNNTIDSVTFYDKTGLVIDKIQYNNSDGYITRVDVYTNGFITERWIYRSSPGNTLEYIYYYQAANILKKLEYYDAAGNFLRTEDFSYAFQDQQRLTQELANLRPQLDAELKKTPQDRDRIAQLKWQISWAEKCLGIVNGFITTYLTNVPMPPPLYFPTYAFGNPPPLVLPKAPVAEEIKISNYEMS